MYRLTHKQKMLPQIYQLIFYTSTEQLMNALHSKQFGTVSNYEQNNISEIISENCQLTTHHFHLESVHLTRLAHEFKTTPTIVSLAIFGIIIHRYMPRSESVNILVKKQQLIIPIQDRKFSTIIASICLDGNNNMSNVTSSTSSVSQSSTIVERPLILFIDIKPSGSDETISECQLVYSNDYLDDKTAHGMCEAFQCLLKYLDNFARTCDFSYTELISIPLTQSSTIIDGPSDLSFTTAGSSNTIYTYFQSIANRYSEHICLQMSGVRPLTYSKCLILVDHFSSILQQQLGVTKSSIIGLWMHNSFEYVIALLATLKLGAIFIPLDVKHPPERLEFIEKQSHINIILTNNNNISLRKNDPVFSAPKIQVNITDDEKLETDNLVS